MSPIGCLVGLAAICWTVPCGAFVAPGSARVVRWNTELVHLANNIENHVPTTRVPIEPTTYCTLLAACHDEAVSFYKYDAHDRVASSSAFPYVKDWKIEATIVELLVQLCTCSIVHVVCSYS